MSRHVILYRGTEFEKDEMGWASQFFNCINRRPEIQQSDLVVGRYSLLPYYLEQEQDIDYVGAKLINSYTQHQYIADLGNYILDLGSHTPKTWRNIEDIPEDGPFVLKGETNSRKHSWLKDMYAANKQDAITVYNRLTDDSLIGNQKIYIRQYIPLVKYLDGVNGAPVTKEFRFFVAYQQLLCGAYYWSNYIADIGREPSANEVPVEFLQDIISRVGTQSNFYTIDVGQTLSGDWIVIELNDGQMAGLSCNEPYNLYSRLSQVLKDKQL